MSLKDAQKDVHGWIEQYKIGYFKPLEIQGAITEEVGELAKEINNIYGPKTKKAPEDTNDLDEEIVNIIFNLICLANSHNIDLDEAWRKKMNKCYSRDKDRWEKKEE